MSDGKVDGMTRKGFGAYASDVLARLVKVCSQKHHTSSRALRIMRWAERQTTTIRRSFEAREPIRDVAAALYRLSAKAM